MADRFSQFSAEEIDSMTDEELDALSQDSYQAPTYSEDGVLQINLSDAPQKQPLTPTENIVGGMGNLLDAGTFGYGDEITAGGSATLDSLFGDSSFGDAYDERLSQMRDIQKRYGEENPVTSTVSNIVAGFANPINSAVKINSLKNAALSGAVLGGAYGFGEGEGGLEERVSNAGTGGLYGAITGGTVYGGLKGAERFINAKSASRNTPEKILDRNFNASNKQISETDPKSLVKSVSNLEEVNPQTATSIFGSKPQKAWQELKARKSTIGTKLDSVYDNLSANPANDIPLQNVNIAQGVSAPIFKSNATDELLNILYDPNSTPDMQLGAMEALDDFAQTIGNRGKLSAKDAWEIAKNLEAETSFTKSPTSPQRKSSYTDSFKQKIAEGLREYVENTQGGDVLKPLNKEYSALAKLSKNADEASSKAKLDESGLLTSITGAIGGIRPNYPILASGGAIGLMGSPALGTGIAALSLGAGAMNSVSRSPMLARSLYRLNSAVSSGSALLNSDATKLAILGSTLLPRSGNALAEDPEGFANEIGFYLQSKTGNPELAKVVSDEIRDIAINGNKAVHDQVIQGLIQQFPDAFEPAPEGYQSFLDGKLLDPMEQSVHINKALDLDLSPREQADVIGGMLSKKKYSPINTSQSNPVSMNQPMQQQNPLSLFNSSFGSEDAVEVPYSGTEQTGDMLRRLSEALSFKEEYDPMTAQ